MEIKQITKNNTNNSHSISKNIELIKKMKTNCKFQQITTAGVKESHIHDIAVTKEAPNYKTER